MSHECGLAGFVGVRKEKERETGKVKELEVPAYPKKGKSPAVSPT